MGLVLETTQKPAYRVHVSASAKSLEPVSWRSYGPLIVIFLVLTLATLALSANDVISDDFSFERSITYFMAGFFLVFSGFKLIDLKGFKEGYSTYDLIAQRIPAYGYVYPFLELIFGLLMLVSFHPPWLLWTEFAVMAVSGVGVFIKIIKKEEFQCLCLGTFLKVPLTHITLIEDFGMAFLALLLLLV